MSSQMDRPSIIKAMGTGGAVFAMGLPDFAETQGPTATMKGSDFYVVQLTDSHWGFEGAKANPDAKGTLAKAIDAVNASTRSRTSSSSPGISPTSRMIRPNGGSAWRSSRRRQRA